jgi:hypothetical protein
MVGVTRVNAVLISLPVDHPKAAMSSHRPGRLSAIQRLTIGQNVAGLWLLYGAKA